MSNWYDSFMIEDGLIDTVWQEGLNRFNGAMRFAQSKFGEGILGACSLAFDFGSNAIRSSMESEAEAYSSSAITAEETEQESMVTMRIQHALTCSGLQLEGISGFGEAEVGCASPMIYMANIRSPSSSMYRKHA